MLFNAIVRRNFRNNKNAVAEDDVRKDLSKGSVSQDGEVLVDTHGNIWSLRVTWQKSWMCLLWI